MNKFKGVKLEQTFIEISEKEGVFAFLVRYHFQCDNEVLIEKELTGYWKNHYAKKSIAENEIQSIILQ
jgi:hypothetical protein